jgi:hypothetical protein
MVENKRDVAVGSSEKDVGFVRYARGGSSL